MQGKLINADLDSIKQRIFHTVDGKVAAAIEETISSLDKAVKQAIYSAVGLKKDTWSGNVIFDSPNGRRSPACVVAEERVAALLRASADALTQEAYDEALPDIKQAMSEYIKKEFKRDFRETIKRLIEQEAKSMATILLTQAKTQCRSIVDEVIKPQLSVAVDSDGAYDLSDPSIAMSAAGIKALEVLAERL